MELGLKDKVVLVTGASKGIGKAVAIAFGAEASHVVLTARGQQELVQVAEEIQQKGGTALPIVADITKAASIEQSLRE